MRQRGISLAYNEFRPHRALARETPSEFCRHHLKGQSVEVVNASENSARRCSKLVADQIEICRLELAETPAPAIQRLVAHPGSNLKLQQLKSGSRRATGDYLLIDEATHIQKLLSEYEGPLSQVTPGPKTAVTSRSPGVLNIGR